jgi:hypothetical protein
MYKSLGAYRIWAGKEVVTWVGLAYKENREEKSLGMHMEFRS